MPLQELLLLERLVAAMPESPPPEYAAVWQQVRSATSAASAVKFGTQVKAYRRLTLGGVLFGVQ
jgi:hypothetical protein